MTKKFLSVFKQYRLLTSQLSYAREGRDKNCFIYSLGLGCNQTDDTNETELRDIVVQKYIYF
jgi:hypothetical protein